MGWTNSVFQLLIVVSGPNKTGLFVYNGAPAKGNLVAHIVAPGVTSDPYGNAVAAVANFGHWNASGALLKHFGIDASGNTYLANSAGLTVVFENSSDGSIQFYNTSGAGLGNLVASIAPAAGTDPSGNPYFMGILSYSSTFYAQLAAGVLRFSSITSSPFATPEVVSLAAGAAGTQINIISGKGTSGATGVTASFYDSLNSPQLTAQVVIGPVINAVAPSTTALLEVQGNVDISTAGSGLRVAEGSNAKQGTATLAGGTKLVANTSVTASSRIFLTAQDNSSTGALRVSARTAGTSFTITSSNAADSGIVAWEIFEPG